MTSSSLQSLFSHNSFVEDIYGAGYVTPQMGVAGAILIVLGVYLMIFGFRGFRPTLAVSGFLTFGKDPV